MNYAMATCAYHCHIVDPCYAIRLELLDGNCVVRFNATLPHVIVK